MLRRVFGARAVVQGKRSEEQSCGYRSCGMAAIMSSTADGPRKTTPGPEDIAPWLQESPGALPISLGRASGSEGPNSSWYSTFPELVLLRKNEWLPGVLLRCDDANRWPPGTVARYGFVPSSGLGTLNRPVLFLVATTFDLKLLADVMAYSLAALNQTTYRPELSRLYGTSTPNARLFGPVSPFHCCPLCIRAARYLSRELLVPWVQHCHYHRVQSRYRCDCGARLRPFPKHAVESFACPSCGTPWSDLAALEVSDEATYAEEHARMELYRTLLDEGSPAALHRIQHQIRKKLSDAGLSHVPLGNGALASNNHFGSERVSLAVLVAGLVSLHLDAGYLRDVFSSRQSTPREWQEQLYCLNRTCPCYRLRGGRNVHLAGHRNGIQESYCDICGSRFLGLRICLSFDSDCDTSGFSPSPQSIQRAQRRLARWQQQLHAVCQHMLQTQLPITVEKAFALAGIPRTRNIRAERLQLVAIVQRYVAQQQLMLTALGNIERWAFRHKMHRRKRVVFP